MNISEVIPNDNFLLRVRTEDGRSGVFDVSPYLAGEAFKPLRNPTEFRTVRSHRYFIEWECGADLSADTILARWKPDSSNERLVIPDKRKIKSPTKPESTDAKSYSVEVIREDYNQAYTPWSEEADEYLRQRFSEGASVEDMSNEFGRQPGGIDSRLRKLGLK